MLKKNETRFNSYNFARYKWGSFSSYFSPICNSFILDSLINEPTMVPKNEDWEILRNLLGILSSNNQKMKASDAIDLWKDILPSNKQERKVLFESFISIGIITPSRITQKDYDSIPIKSSWSDDAALWRGDDSPNLDIVLDVFGNKAIA